MSNDDRTSTNDVIDYIGVEKLDANSNGKYEVSELTNTYSAVLIEKPENFNFEGRNFIGWGSTKTATNPYSAGYTFENLTEDISLYAIWGNKTYTIEFNDKYNYVEVPDSIEFEYNTAKAKDHYFFHSIRRHQTNCSTVQPL